MKIAPPEDIKLIANTAIPAVPAITEAIIFLKSSIKYISGRFSFFCFNNSINTIFENPILIQGKGLGISDSETYRTVTMTIEKTYVLILLFCDGINLSAFYIAGNSYYDSVWNTSEDLIDIRNFARMNASFIRAIGSCNGRLFFFNFN